LVANRLVLNGMPSASLACKVLISGKGSVHENSDATYTQRLVATQEKHSDNYEHSDIFSNRFDFFDKSNYNIVLFC
jgi:hypothetical protein